MFETEYGRIKYMKITKLTVMILGLMLTCLSFTSTALADGARSYISATGSDNRPCTRNQPCRTFDGALAKTDAGGEIVAIDTGAYDPTTVTKSITLAAAPGADVAIRANAGNAVTISGNSGDTIVLRGLRLAGPGKNVSGTNGVLLDISSPNCCVSVHIENSIISDFDKGVQMDLGVASQLIVSDTVFRANKTGVYFSVGGAESQGASITHSRFERNDVGLLTFTGNSVTVSNSTAAANGVAFQADPGGKLDVVKSTITRNGTGIKSSGGHIRIADCTIAGNGSGVSTSTGTVSSMGNNMIVNNDIDVAGTQNFLTFLPR
jgi:hypothetical protein